MIKLKVIMAKRGRKKGSKNKKPAPKSILPAGFWAQVVAVAMILFSFFLVLSWFNKGGAALEFIHGGLLKLMGYATFFLPFLTMFLAVEIFRDEQNKLSGGIIFASAVMIFWLSGLFGLIGLEYGGFTGELANKIMLAMVNSAVAALIYSLLIFVTILSVLKITPIVVIRKIGEMIKTDNFSTESTINEKTMRQAMSIENSAKPTPLPEIKLNAGVEVIGKKDRENQKKKLLSARQAKPEKETPSATLSEADSNWQKPSFDLLEKSQSPADAGDIEQNARIIKDTLSEFNIDVEMEAANIGPRVTQYTLRPPSGVKLSRITAVESNIALNLAAQNLRIEAPIPGKRAVGIEVPNIKSADVRLSGVLTSKEWKNAHDPLSFAVGKDISGESVVGNLGKMPHLLIAGQTGAGKSVMMNSLLTSLLFRHSPSEMKLILIDPKKVEMAPYEDIPHLLTPVINDPEKALSALKWAVNEMERRYDLLAEEKIRDIKSYNKMIIARAKAEGDKSIEDGSMPYIVVVVDELSDLMMVASKDTEAMIVRLAQKARAIGIHLVLATQRPSVNVVTGLIKANVPSRIAFTVASNVDSRTILDQGGAEKLLGQGDMLFYASGMSKPKRVQGAWITDDEVNKITDFLRLQSPPRYNDDVVSQPVQIGDRGGVVMGEFSGSTDETFNDAVRIVVEARKASTSYLQRRLSIGYGRAAKLIDEMEERGIVGPQNGSKPREVLISSLEEIDF